MTAAYRPRATRHYAPAIVADAKLKAPKDTLDLAESIEQVPDGDDVLIGSDLDYAAAQELGASEHPIPNAFGRGESVMHPGNRAQPYLRPALYKRRAG